MQSGSICMYKRRDNLEAGARGWGARIHEVSAAAITGLLEGRISRADMEMADGRTAGRMTGVDGSPANNRARIVGEQIIWISGGLNLRGFLVIPCLHSAGIRT